MTTTRSTRVVSVAAGAVLALALTGCGGSDDKPAATSSTSASASSSPSSAISPSATPSRPPVTKGLAKGYPSAKVPVGVGKVKRSTPVALDASGKQVDGWTVQLTVPGTVSEAIAKVTRSLAAKGYKAGAAKKLGGKVKEIVYTSADYRNRVDFIPAKGSTNVLYNITPR